MSLAKYDIGNDTIYGIKKGKYYKDITQFIKEGPGLNDEVKNKIKPKLLKPVIVNMYLSEGYISDLAKLFGVKNSMIVNIKQRRTHKNITNDLGPAGVYWSGELSPQIIKDICESTRSVAELAKKYGIVDNTVRYVRKKHGSVIPVKTQRQPLTKEQVIEIYHSTLSLKELNDKFGTDNHAVIKIKQKIRFKKLYI